MEAQQRQLSAASAVTTLTLLFFQVLIISKNLAAIKRHMDSGHVCDQMHVCYG